MKALLCKEFGPIDQLSLGEVPDPQPGPDEVRINVKACGVNFPDILIAQGLYQARPDFPFSPGSEVAGVIDQVGADVTQFKEGDRVAAYMRSGGLADLALAKAAACIPLDDNLDLITASCFLVTYGTSYHALKDRARLQKGETLVVLGAAGGVGLACVELGKMMGAEVLAMASTQEKLEICKQYGADALVNYSEEDIRESIKRHTKGKGADVIYDPVGGASSETALRSLGYDGRLLVIGFTSGTIPKIPLNLPLLKVSSIVGVFWGGFMERFPLQAHENHLQLQRWMAEGKLKPYIQKKFTLEQSKEALRHIANRKAIGKVVVTMD